MKINETPEAFLARACRSPGLKKLAVIIVLAGMVICFLCLLPPVQRVLFSFVDAGTSDTGLRSGGNFGSRLQSLFSLPFFGLLVLILILCCLFSKQFAEFFEDDKNNKVIIIFGAVITVLLAFIGIFSYLRGRQWLHSDHSSEMVLGKLLADENTFVTKNWYYSTEIRLVYQTLFTMPLFKIFGNLDNWALIRSLNIVLNNTVLILSYIFLTRQMKIRAKWICISALFLLMPLSFDYWDIVTFGGFYIFLIAQIFCCLGLFIRLGYNSDTVKTAVPWFIIFTALSFALGVQGIRSLLCVHIPLLFTCVWLYLKPRQEKRFPLFLGCYGFIVCLAGFAVNFLLHFKYRFFSYDNERIGEHFYKLFEKIGQNLVALAEFFGLASGTPLLSARGLLGVIAIAGIFLLFRSAAILMKKKDACQFPPAFFIVSVVFNIFVFVVAYGGFNSRYFIPFMILYIPIMAVLFTHAEKIYGHSKRTVIICGITLFIFSQGYLNFQNIAGYNPNSGRKGYIEYLLDNNLDYGFATFWNANVTSELTNGKIELAGLKPDRNPGERFSIFGWLTPANSFDPSHHKGESFLLLTDAEWKEAREAGWSFTRREPDYDDGNFVIRKYPSAEIIHREVFDKP